MQYPDYSVQLDAHVHDYYHHKHMMEHMIREAERMLEFDYWY